MKPVQFRPISLDADALADLFDDEPAVDTASSPTMMGCINRIPDVAEADLIGSPDRPLSRLQALYWLGYGAGLSLRPADPPSGLPDSLEDVFELGIGDGETSEWSDDPEFAAAQIARVRPELDAMLAEQASREAAHEASRTLDIQNILK